MTGSYWILLNLLLLCGAVCGTYAVSTRPPQKPLDLAPKEQPAKKENRGATASATPARKNTTATSNASLDGLWKHTLFNPGREESSDADASAPAQNNRTTAANAQAAFELIGIAQLAPENAPTPMPIAIIRQRQNNTRYNRNARQQQSQPTKPVKEIFKEGESINETGYVLKSIDVANRSVELTKGRETLTLNIDFSNAQAAQRRNTAVQTATKERQAREAAQQRAEAAANANKNAAQPGTPPGPPGANGRPTPINIQNNQRQLPAGGTNRQGNQNVPLSQLSPEERSQRIQQLVEARRRMNETQPANNAPAAPAQQPRR